MRLDALLRRLGALMALLIVLATPARAETVTVRIARQPGVSYLPLIIMEHEKLLEKHAQALGIQVRPEWLRFTGGAAMNDALLSGNLDIASGGVPPLLILWARTQGSLKVRGIAALAAQPQYLLTVNPKVKSLADFTAGDRIAMPAAKVSNQAVMLQMAAAKELGEDKTLSLDPLTVSMGHPDAMAAMLGGSGAVNSHFSQAPFQDIALRDPRVHIVLDSWKVVGGPFPVALTMATTPFARKNPGVLKAFLSALKEAQHRINSDRSNAARIWIESDGANLTQKEAEAILNKIDLIWDTAPRNTITFLKHMNKTGAIQVTTNDWRDIYFDFIAREDGS